MPENTQFAVTVSSRCHLGICRGTEAKLFLDKVTELCKRLFSTIDQSMVRSTQELIDTINVSWQ